MKYMLMMNVPGGGAYQINDWDPEDIKRHIDFQIALHDELTRSGELLSAEGLAGPDQAKLVRATTGGPPVTDEPFQEAREFLAGFWIVEVESEDRAIEIAAKASAAPGRNGEPLNLGIEVREVMAGPPPTDES